MNLKQTLLTTLTISLLACNKEDITPKSSGQYAIVVGAFKLSDGEYTATGNELIFKSEEDCQIWSRNAQGDNHSSAKHLHYNAATDVSYNYSTKTFSWTEYGPELNETAIDSTCNAGIDGVKKIVTNIGYYKDKPNVYLRITSVTEIK